MTIIEYALIILMLLQVKHWYIDFVNQSMEEVNGKGIYGNWQGVKHSAKQGLGTFLVFALAGSPHAFLIGLFDFVLHYHIDWCKMNYGNRDIQTPQFWNHLGLDQMAHQLSYLLFIFIALG